MLQTNLHNNFHSMVLLVSALLSYGFKSCQEHVMSLSDHWWLTYSSPSGLSFRYKNRVERCTPFQFTYFANMFFVILHTSPMFTYFRYKSIVSDKNLCCKTNCTTGIMLLIVRKCFTCILLITDHTEKCFKWKLWSFIRSMLYMLTSCMMSHIWLDLWSSVWPSC
jgi:hypothetical protein